MSSPAEAFIVGGVVGVVPLLLGFVPSWLVSKKRQGWYAMSAGTALGFLSLFFTDLIDDSAELGVSLGLALRPSQLALAALFLLGFAALLAVSRVHAVSRGAPFVLAYLVAFGIGLHALGEGMIIGNNLVGQASIEDFSTLMQGLSFALHKFLEGFTIALFLIPKIRPRPVGICTILAGLPLIAGIPLGFFTYPAIFANFLFAAGAGAVLFIIVKIAANLEYEKNTRNLVLGFLVGFLLVYLGSLIHFAEIPGS